MRLRPSCSQPLRAMMAVALISTGPLGCAPQTAQGGLTAPCKPGQVVGCQCENGGNGEKTCEGEKFGACVCVDAGPVDSGSAKKPDAITAGDTQQPGALDIITGSDTAPDTALTDTGAADAVEDSGPVDAGAPVSLAAMVTTVAGSGDTGDDDGAALLARFRRPQGVAQLGDTIYVVDFLGNRLRAVTGGKVTTLAGKLYGHADGKGDDAKFRHPAGLAVDGQTLLIADRDNHMIRRFDPKTGNLSTVVGNGKKGYKNGMGDIAMLAGPEDVTKADDGRIYIADTQNSVLRSVLPNGNLLAATEGGVGYQDGNGKKAKFAFPSGIASLGKLVYVADTVNHVIRSYNTNNGEVATIAGAKQPGSKDGKGADALFNFPRGLTVDPKGVLYVADTSGNRIRKVATDGTVTTIAGLSAGYKDGPAEAALFAQPWGISVTASGSLLIADSKNLRVRKYHLVAAN